jgi:hypothetical protein
MPSCLVALLSGQRLEASPEPVPVAVAVAVEENEERAIKARLPTQARRLLKSRRIGCAGVATDHACL